MCLHRSVDASYVMIRMQLHAKTNTLTLQRTYIITSYSLSTARFVEKSSSFASLPLSKERLFRVCLGTFSGSAELSSLSRFHSFS